MLQLMKSVGFLTSTIGQCEWIVASSVIAFAPLKDVSFGFVMLC